jgi:hypothetical protein
VPDPVVALLTLLKEDSKLDGMVKGRIYRNRVPDAQVTRMPRNLILLRPAGSSMSYGRGYQQYSDVRVDVFCYGHGSESAYAIFERVRDLLKQLTRVTVGDTVIHLANHAGGPVAGDDPQQAYPYGRAIDPQKAWPYVLSSWQIVVADIAVQTAA